MRSNLFAMGSNQILGMRISVLYCDKISGGLETPFTWIIYHRCAAAISSNNVRVLYTYMIFSHTNLTWICRIASPPPAMRIRQSTLSQRLSLHTPPSQMYNLGCVRSISLTNLFRPRIHSPFPGPKPKTVLPTPTCRLNAFTFSATSSDSTPTTTIPFPPQRSQTTDSSMPTKHQGNCSTSASNAWTVSRARRA